MIKQISHIMYLVAFLVIITGCSQALPWPDSPLYSFDDKKQASDLSLDELKAKLVGHYAHYDVVSYIDTTTQSPMNSFIISYGFTDFFLDSVGNLIQSNRFLHAEQKINQPHITSTFNDIAIQAIKPNNNKVEFSMIDGKWQIFRPSTPSLLGIKGDPLKPLSKDPNDPNLTDPDGDGKPGMTVEINIGNIIKGEIYITRREIFSYHLQLNTDGTLTGNVIDESEQFVIGASKKILAQESNAFQHPDKGMNPILLIPIDKNIDTYEELLAIKQKLFPPEPEFIQP